MNTMLKYEYVHTRRMLETEIVKGDKGTLLDEIYNNQSCVGYRTEGRLTDISTGQS